MPVDPSVWKEDGSLDCATSSALGNYGTLPDSILDFTQEIADLNGRPTVHDARIRVAELRAETETWPEAQSLFVQELRLRWPQVKIPAAAVGDNLRHVLEWLRDAYDQKALESAAPDAGRRLAAAVLRASGENWADFDHARVLNYLRDLDPILCRQTEAAIPGCREVPLRLDRRGPTATIALDPDSLRLTYREYRNGEVEHTAEVVPTSFVVERFRAEDEDDWFRWTQADGQPFQSPRGDLIDEVRRKFHPSQSMVRGVAAWLEALPRGEEVSTRLTLKGPKNAAGTRVGWWVPSVFSRQSEGRTDAAGILAGWYRPRSQEEADRRLGELLGFLTSDKLRAILCYVVGAPIFAKLWPTRPFPYLELVGESRVGKTKSAQASIAVAWGLGDGYREYLGGDAIRSNFRRLSFGSATDFPLLVDESSLDRKDREHLRAQTNGSTSTRGGTDLLHSAYKSTAPMIFTANASPDDSDSSSAEQHGDDRRRIRLFFDSTDLDAVAERRDAFERWLRRLPQGEVDPEGGGSALWRLNELYRRDDGGELVEAVAERAGSEQQLVLDLGALVIGIPPVRIEEERSDHSAEAFLEWVRTETARYWEASRQALSERFPRSDPVLHRYRMEAEDGAEAISPDATHSIWITASALDEYKAYRRRMGASSPYHRLQDLGALAPITSQNLLDMMGPKEKGRATARGRNVRINGVQVRAVKLLLPDSGRSEGVDKKLPEEGSEYTPA